MFVSNPLILLAQADGSASNAWVIAAIVAAVFIVPFVIGTFIAKALKMNEYATRIGVMLLAICAAAAILGTHWDPEQKQLALNWGVDLLGGDILIYEVAENIGDPDNPNRDPNAPLNSSEMGALCQAITRRINPDGLKEIVVRPYGERQIEIIIPGADEFETDRIKRLIVTAGQLAFRILAKPEDADLVALAKAQAESITDRVNKFVLSDPSNPQASSRIGMWVRVGRETEEVDGVKPLREDVSRHIIRDSRSGQILDPIKPGSATVTNAAGQPVTLDTFLAEQGVKEIDVLVKLEEDSRLHVNGEHLRIARPDTDEQLRPCVSFVMTGPGAGLMQVLTSSNLPDDTTGSNRQLGIILDGQLLSAPNIITTITDQGRITGRFSKAEVEDLVGILKAGSLPAMLQEKPISENQIGSMLGADTIEKGTLSIGLSLALVLAFILVYYRFSGIVACLALIINLVLIIALMILLGASVTLPGLAGLVLTVGMSVDANVLIFERIREELTKGSALRMAIRNGFARATTTIVDANITTLITAGVLYYIGTDQVRGFAVTLFLGILMSMFTAIFCSRIVFDIYERKRRPETLGMMHILGATSFDFIGKRQAAAIVSIVLILAGLVAVGMRGRGIFDLDFNGGSSVVMVLNKPMQHENISTILDKISKETKLPNGSTAQFNLTEVRVKDQEPDTHWKVESSLPSVDSLKDKLNDSFDLRHYEMKYTSSEQASRQRRNPVTLVARRRDLPSASFVAAAGASLVALLEQEDAEPVDDPPAAESSDADAAPESPAPVNPGDTSGASPSEPARPAAPGPIVSSSADLKFEYSISPTALQAEIKAAAEKAEIPLTTDVVVDNKEWDKTSSVSLKDWTVTLDTNQSSLQTILDTMRQKLGETPVWQSASTFGSKVVGDTRTQAVMALLASLLGIVGYIWIRFQRVIYGLAAVVALIHDVLFVLGAIAISKWLAPAFGFLLMDEFKISLPVVAAFLTIIGYSLNDTIVVFDRIREVRGKNPKLTKEMINTSINQTLSRTLLTSLTTFIVVLILYALGGQGIHGFAFALLIGVLVGTYSSIFVASPALLWMSKSQATPSKSMELEKATA